MLANRYVTRGVCLALLATAAFAAEAQTSRYSGIGRTATPAEIKAWDIDVRPDFAGLPPGAGSVQQGQQVWEAKCESCHGTFGESNEVFTPIAGGTTKRDIETGRVATLTRPDFPQRTTLMKLSQISSLWDYVNRAMPWNAPKSLSTDEVYAVVAYILSLGDIVPGDFVLSDKNIAQVQARLPNRNGLVKYLPMWDVRGKGDVANTACMRDCLPAGRQVVISSSLPDHARNAHGNLAEQNRIVGPVRGADTTRPPPPALMQMQTASVASAAAKPLTAPELAKKSTCVACHAPARKLVGPSYADIAKKYAGDATAVSKLIDKVRRGGSGNWGVIPMPPHADMSEADLKMLVEWVLQGGN
jgi:cytochrome c